jgi:hypothetical protein
MFGFVGTVESVETNLLGIDVEPGDGIGGSYTFESTAVDEEPQPCAGLYMAILPPVIVELGGNVLVIDSLDINEIIVTDQGCGFDLYNVIADGSGTLNDQPVDSALFFPSMADLDNTAISGDALPIVPPVVSDFEIQSWFISVSTAVPSQGALGSSFRVRFDSLFLLPETISIAIKLGNTHNPINPLGRGVVPVAILGSDTFDVTDVDASTLAFGSAGAPLAHRNGPHSKDANHDGFTDLLAHFLTEEAGIAPGDEEACVTGELLDGTAFEGCDAITTQTPSGRCGLGFELTLMLAPLCWIYGQRRRRRVE